MNSWKAGSHVAGRTAVTAALIACACAQASSPPGGEPDRLPPRIIATVPEHNAVVPAFSGEVRITFDETLSERGVREGEMAVVSPELGEFDVNRDGNQLKIRAKSGWQANRIYHITVLPGLQDRHGNSRTGPFELVFSTGPEIPPNALAGLVADRLTGRPVAGANVVAIAASDSTVYRTSTDTAGFYALRGMPLGLYRMMAFVDINRNRSHDFIEPRDSALVNIATVTDTVVREFAVLAMDTTPARLLKAEARDSLQVRLSFDDFIEAGVPLNSIIVSLWQLPDSSTVLGAGKLMHVRDFDALQRADTTRPPPPVRPGTPATDTSRVLPAQEFVWVPPQPLRPAGRYRINVVGVVNIAGVRDGGGSVAFEVPARARPPVRDTTATPVRPDSTSGR